MTATATQLDLAGMPARLFACTPSRLTTWLDCPRRYKFVYVDRPVPAKGPPWAHNSVGASVHAALAAWWSLPVERRTPTTAGALVRSKWSGLGFRDDEQAAQWRSDLFQAGAYLRNVVGPAYLSAAFAYGWQDVTTDRTVTVAGIDQLRAKFNPNAFSGRIDRLDRRDDELVVVDYKTGRHVLTTDDARGSLALALYAAAAARTLRQRCVAVELHHLPTGRVVRWEHTDATLDRHLGRAHDIAAEAAAAAGRIERGEDVDAVYPPRAGPMCGWCDFSAHCPQGRAAAPPQASWAGLAEDIRPPDDD